MIEIKLATNRPTKYIFFILISKKQIHLTNKEMEGTTPFNHCKNKILQSSIWRFQINKYIYQIKKWRLLLLLTVVKIRFYRALCGLRFHTVKPLFFKTCRKMLYSLYRLKLFNKTCKCPISHTTNQKKKKKKSHITNARCLVHPYI